MEQTLYNVTETAKRLGMSTTTLRRRAKEGKIKPRCGNKYHIDDILKYEGTDTSKLSPFERRRLEREIEELTEELEAEKEENERIKRNIRNIMADMAQMSRE